MPSPTDTAIQTQPNTGRKRTGTKKSKTGCRTCRARHVKCDEAPGACKKCTSTGRTCEYDLQRLPRPYRVRSGKESGPLQQLIPPEIADRLRWSATTDERRCYWYFQSQTISTLSGFFDSPLWQEILPQRSLSDPAVYHAVIALTAVHQDLEMHGLPLPGQDLQNAWNRFALDQCSRSYGLLARRHASQDPHLREVMLLCCLLFVITELFRSQYDEAFRHLQCGLRILYEAKQNPREPPVAPVLVAAFTNLEIQSLQYGAPELVLENDETKQLICAFRTPEVFSSFYEARRSLDTLLNSVFLFLTHTGGLSAEEILADYETFYQKQTKLLSQCSGFISRLDMFCAHRTFNAKEQRGVDIMRLIQRSLTLMAKMCLLRDETALNDYFIAEHIKNVAMAEEIMNRFPDRPSVTLDVGIIPPLYSAAMWCPDHNVRRHAIAVLKSWPHREGPFESEWAAWVASEQLKAETISELEEGIQVDESGKQGKSEVGRWSGREMTGFTLENALTATECMERWPCVRSVRYARASRDNTPKSSPDSQSPSSVLEKTLEKDDSQIQTALVVEV